jgi:enoyl-CoA hydratase
MVTYHSSFDKPLDYKDIIYEKDKPIARIILNRPEKMNALRHQLRGEVFHALRVAEADPEVGVIIIKGAGRCFSAGYDLGGGNQGFTLPDVGPRHPGIGQWPRHLNAGYYMIWELEKVVIAQAHGYCLAGGTELAAYCDLFVVAEDLQIGYPPVRAMSPPDNLWFPWHMSMRKAKEMLFTGDPITGEEAVELGLANYAVPADKLDEFTTNLAKRVALIAPSLLALSKRQINKVYDIMGHRLAMEVGNLYQGMNPQRPEAGEFGRISREHGLKAALNWRDEKFGDYGTTPAAKMARDMRKQREVQQAGASRAPANRAGVGREE